MPDVTATTHVFPSANDLFGGGAAGDGKNMREGNLAGKWTARLVERNFVLSGFVLPASDPDLTITVPTGKAYIAGYFLDVAATNLTLTASATNHIFLKLLRDGNQNVSSVAFEHNTTGTAPADSVKIGTAVTSASAVTSTTDARILTPTRVFTQFQVFTAGGTFNMPTDRGEVFCEVYGAGGGGGGGGAGVGGCTPTPSISSGQDGANGGYGADVFSVTPGSANTITIGAAGSAGAGGTSGGNGSSGGAGGTSSFGSSLSATGGGGGAGGKGSGGINPVSQAGAAKGTSSATININGGGAGSGAGGQGGASSINGTAGTVGQAGRVIVWY